MKSAVLFLIFNRPETTTRVLNTVRAAKPPRLYVAGDGPRSDYPEDVDLVEKTRKIYLQE